MLVLLREWFIHPNGAIPSYEWSFDDVNPPVQAMAAIRIFQVDGHRDVAFLKRAFHKLLLNFTWHETPYELPGVPGATIGYEPAESRTNMYGGNSNWRGPVWMPVNYLVVRALVVYQAALGDGFTMEYPTGSGQRRTLAAIADDLTDRLLSPWRRGPDGRRPVFGAVEVMQADPAWRDNLLFFEYFHGDDGAGLGASHQTGWTALVVDLLLDPPGRSRPAGPPARPGRLATPPGRLRSSRSRHPHADHRSGGRRPHVLGCAHDRPRPGAGQPVEVASCAGRSWGSPSAPRRWPAP